MVRKPDPLLRTKGFRKAEASLKLEGMDPAGTPLYESIKKRIIDGEITYEQGRADILAHYSGVAIAESATVDEILQEEFLTPLNMSHEALALMMDVSCQVIEDIICGRRRLTAAEACRLAEIFGTDEDFWSNLQALSDRR
jgi:addiction module HigA family antidote